MDDYPCGRYGRVMWSWCLERRRIPVVKMVVVVMRERRRIGEVYIGE